MSDNNNCKWEYYNDIYNAEKNTNTEQCHSLDLLRLSGYIKDTIRVNNIEEIQPTINKYFEENKNIKYYGIQKNVFGEYNIIFLPNLNNLSSISPSYLKKYNCLHENKYIGSSKNVMIYKKQGQCKTGPKCEWDEGSPELKIKCSENSEERNCLEQKDCYFDYKNNKCLPKGKCLSLNIYDDEDTANTANTANPQRPLYSLEDEIGKLPVYGDSLSSSDLKLQNTRVTPPVSPHTFNPVDTSVDTSVEQPIG